LNDGDYDEGFDLTDVLSSDVQSLVAFESSNNPGKTRPEDFDDENGDSDDLCSIALLMRILALVSKNYIGSNCLMKLLL